MSGEVASGPIDLSWAQLGGASLLVLANGAASVWLGLGLERRLLVAALRTFAQLTLLGFVLVPVLEARQPWLVAAIALAMTALAAREGVRRAGRAYPRVALDGFVSLAIAAGATVVLATTTLIGVEPWWEPRYLVPLLGMILGNGLTGISLGLDRALTLLDEGRARVELLLALGATRWEAGRPVVAEAVRSGTIPILNSMTVVGLVTIPGMMTGQLLAGSPPLLAAKYQILVMFLIAGATAAGTCGVVLLAALRLLDDEHRLRLDRLARRAR